MTITDSMSVEEQICSGCPAGGPCCLVTHARYDDEEITDMRTGPSDYTGGLGEVIRGYRLYIGMSEVGMARKLDMSMRSYTRIEYGFRACPPGLLDTLQKIVVEFDEAVEKVISESEGQDGKHNVSLDPLQEWERCVVNRAATMSPAVMPVLVK